MWPRLRGSALPARRARRNFAMRRATCGSSLASCLRAVSVSLTVQAKIAFHFVQRPCPLLAGPYSVRDLIGQIEVFQIVDLLGDRLNQVEGLASPGTSRQPFQARLHVIGQSK